VFEFLFGKAKTHALVIEGVEGTFEVRKKETILDAALRAGIDFPNDCRVGACTSCKCRVVEGEISEITRSSLVLDRADANAGYVLACQSIPKTDVRVFVDAIGKPRLHPKVVTKGAVRSKRVLTHDTAEIIVSTDAPMAYTAGQYARLTLPSVSTEDRSYSFARAPGADRELVFYVREVPGGLLSPQIVRSLEPGAQVELEGPFGEFRLADGEHPVLAIAGGSGLAPIRALLEQIVADGTKRPVTLLFGARTERDLYDLEAIEALGRTMPAGFRFVPILSHESPESTWTGARGFVTTAIAEHAVPGTRAYLCGPPPMIDAAIVELEKAGVGHERIAFDKFTDKSHQKPS